MIAEFIDPAILGFILVGVMLFAIFVGFPISFTLIFLGFVFYKAASFIGFWSVFMITLIFFIVLITIIGSIMTTFQITCWTRFFMELTGKKRVKSKIERVLSKDKKVVSSRT